MYLLSSIGELRVGDMIVQFIFLLIVIALVIGLEYLLVMLSKRTKRLDRTEEKLDVVLSDKEK